MVEDLSQRLKLSFDVELSAPRKYAVTLIKAGNTLHGWRFPVTGTRQIHVEDKARLEGFEPPLSRIRSPRLYPLSYRRAIRGNSGTAEFHLHHTTNEASLQPLALVSPQLLPRPP